MKFKPFLLEIGTEEIPVSYIKPALRQLNEFITSSLNENDIYYNKIDTFATSNRLVIYIKEIAIKRPGKAKTIIGPPVKAAFDKSNKLTKAGYGFAKKFNMGVEEIDVCDTKKGKYICVKKTIPAEDSTKILSKTLPNLIKNVHFPKRMKWDNSGVTFARPIRWICCLFQDQIVKIKIGNVISDRYTYVTPSKKSSKIKVNYVEQYFERIEKAGIILDHRKRKQFLKQQIEKLATKYNAKVIDFQHQLLEEVNFLIQFPTVFTGEFNKSYLKLPSEVLLASMSKYQRVFGLSDKNGQLIPRFIGVADGNPKDLKTVTKNYIMVLESRLQDSLFFFNQDTRTSLEEKIDKLNDVIYYDRLGTMYEKVGRIEQLCKYIADKISLSKAQLRDLERAVWLSKADLTTNMVGEFPSLQGIMGKIYALFDKENVNVANAIYEHYLPRFSGDSLPQNKIGTIISIGDRMDSLVGCFGINLLPTGSYDPYGLRRDTYAIIKLVIHHKISLKLDQLILKSIKLFDTKFRKSKHKIKSEIINFIRDRLKTILVDEYNSSQLVEAVLEVNYNDIFEAYKKVNVLTPIQSKRYFRKACKVSERTKKIYKNLTNITDEVNPFLFEHPLEEKLWKTYKGNESRIDKLIEGGSLKQATKIYGNVFYNILHEFFDKVLVNVDDANLRKNRLALCKKIHDIYNLRVAELSLLENIEVG